MNLVIRHPTGIIQGSVTLPASKSISNRLLIMNALEPGITIQGISDADDTVLMAGLLEQIRNNRSSGENLILDTQNAGTVFRFLLAYLSQKDGRYVLTGSPRMLERPVARLFDALQGLGADVEYTGKPGYPPVRIQGGSLKGGRVRLVDPESSQFISALMLIAPSLPGGLILDMEGEIPSKSYIEMTARLMKEAGITLKMEDKTISVEPGQAYQRGIYRVEKDWSSAAFWYEIAAMSKQSELVIHDLAFTGVQGDERVAEIMKRMGVQSINEKEGIKIRKQNPAFHSNCVVDLSETPDLTQPVAVASAFHNTETIICGISHLRYKETDRIIALQNAFKKIGVDCSFKTNKLIINMFPGKESSPVIDSFGDHRMAMSFSPIALKMRQISILHAEVTSKSYPSFWKELLNIGFIIDAI